MNGHVTIGWHQKYHISAINRLTSSLRDVFDEAINIVITIQQINLYYVQNMNYNILRSCIKNFILTKLID